MGTVAEDSCVELAVKMIRHATQHSFQGSEQEADLVEFCKMNTQYSRLERRVQPNPNSLLADKWDAARNKIVTYITQKVNNCQPNDLILAEALVMVTEPYLLRLHEKDR